MNKLFAIDEKTQEVIVSESPKGSTKIIFSERINKKDNETLYNAVRTLSSITKATELDITLFKAVDKICQSVYEKQKGSQ